MRENNLKQSNHPDPTKYWDDIAAQAEEERQKKARKKTKRRERKTILYKA